MRVDISKLPEFNIDDWENKIRETGVMFIDTKTINKLTLQEIGHLKWIHARLQFIHKENPNFDYMIKFDRIIKKLEDD